jgi:hypothetical protein
MVEKLKDQLICEYLTCSEVTRSKCEDIAERLVEIIEESGMLPPRIQLKLLKFSDNAWDPE